MPVTRDTPTPTARRVLHLLAVTLLVLVALPPPAAQAARFRDVPSTHRFHGNVERLASAGITDGCGSRQYCPDQVVTRGQMAAFLVRMLDLPAGNRHFRDSRRHRFRADIAALAAAGVTKGCNPPANSRFCPDEPVTRAQMATFLQRALDLPRGEHQFVDVRRGWVHAAGINALSHSRITRGCDTHRARFCPHRPVVRGEMAAFLTRALAHQSRRVPSWFDSLPVIATSGNRATVRARGRDNYALWTSRDVNGTTALGGASAAMRATGPVTITNSVLGGATDGLKPDDGTTLRSSVVALRYSRGDHADHVQIRGQRGVTIDRVRLLADNANGRTVGGWNAGIFVHDGATDWTIRRVHVQAGRAGRTIRSWHPVRLYSGRGRIDGLIIDREAMRGPVPVLVDDDVTIDQWRDVFIREPNGSLTRVPRP